jgi:hypothetical protein
MSAPTGSAASNSTKTADARVGYLQALALRREALAVRRHIVYGLVMGWVLTLVAGFVFFCVPSRFDWLWCSLMLVGLMHLAAAVIVPQALAWPERAWMIVARWQGWIVMTALLTAIYFVLIWPASVFSRRRTRGFVAWDSHAPKTSTSWEPIELLESDSAWVASNRYRSLPLLLAAVVGFFFRRGNYLLVLIVVLLVLLGLILYFVESSALAPFIYTLF